MKTLITSLLFFSVCYFTLRYLKLAWEKRQLPPWSKYFLGLLAWGALGSGVGILWGLAQPVIELFTSPNMGVAFLIGGLALAAGGIAKYAHANPELLDFDSMRPFLKDSLAFVNPARSWMNLAEEVDKHEIRRVYKEVTGNDLPDTDQRFENDLKRKLEAAKGKEFSKDKLVPASRKALEELQQPSESPQVKEELRQIRQGSAVDISDSWRINSLKRSSHEYFRLVKSVVVDPVTKQMHLVLESDKFADDRVRTPASLYRLKQDLYDFLQVLHKEKWMEPYLASITHLVCTCSFFEDDAFAGVHTHPVCRVEISRSDLKIFESRFYDVGQMKTEVLV